MNLVIDSVFRPFTYDEMTKPLVQYKEAYDKVEEQYSDLLTLTEAWKNIANLENSPEAYAMYKRYSDDLNALVDDFSKGMNLNNRRALMGMKRRYSLDIVPIATAYEAMKEANKFRDDKGYDAIFEVDRYNSIDDLLNGKVANNRYQSRDALTKKAAAISEAAMAEAMRDPEFRSVMEGQYWDIVQHSGGSYADLAEAMKLGAFDNPILKNKFSEIRQDLARKAGISNYGEQGLRAILDSIDLGMFAGLDKPTHQFLGNLAYLNPLQQEQLKQMKEARALARSGRGGSGGGSGRGRRGSGGDGAEGGAYTPGDVTLEFNSKGQGISFFDSGRIENNNLGKLVSIDGLRKIYGDNVADNIIEYLGGADSKQYNIYLTQGSNGRTRVNIKQKGTYHKKGAAEPTSQWDPSEAAIKASKR